MTTKEIAEAVGQTDRNVRNWIAKLSEKSSAVAEKSSESSPAYPADYDLAEVCLIIEEGLGKQAADVYRTNAANASLSASSCILPSASHIRELRLAVRDKALTPTQFQMLIGLPKVEPETQALLPCGDLEYKKSKNSPFEYLDGVEAIESRKHYPISSRDAAQLLFVPNHMLIIRAVKFLGLPTSKGISKDALLGAWKVICKLEIHLEAIA